MDQQTSINNNVPLSTSTMAIVSLVAGILGFTILPIIASIVAVLTGYAARKETRAVPPRAGGDGLATAGIVMGWIQIGLAVVGFCLIVAYIIASIGIIGWAFHR